MHRLRKLKEKLNPFIRIAIPGEEASIHNAHMKSIREICVLDHGEHEVKGWGNRALGDRWINEIEKGEVFIVEFQKEIHGLGHIKLIEDESTRYGFIQALYFTSEVIGLGLGKKMVDTLILKAQTWNVSDIKLESTITAHGFYKKIGFHDDGNVKKVEVGGSFVTCFPMVFHLNGNKKTI